MRKRKHCLLQEALGDLCWWNRTTEHEGAREVLCRVGIPASLHEDVGSAFTYRGDLGLAG
jgi:hypothetical protein